MSFATREEAEAWEAAVTDADVAGRELPSVAPKNAGEVLLGDFAEEHFEYLWGDTKAKEHTRGQVRMVVDYIGPAVPLKSIDEACVARLISALKREGKANGTINRKLATLSKLLKLGKRLKVVQEVPYWDTLREGQGRERFLSRGEEAQLFDTFEHFGLLVDYDLHGFLLYTGARRGEALRLKWSAVRWEAKEPTHVSFWVTKGGKPRTVPLVGRAKEAILRRHAEAPEATMDAFVFPLSDGTVRTHWDRVRSYLGFGDDPEFVIHMLRHTCASRLVQAGVDLKRVQAWMGHSSIQTTLRYAHLAPDDLDVAGRALAA